MHEPREQKPCTASDMILGLWWVSWFGFISAFLFVGICECKLEWQQRGAPFWFSLTLLLIVTCEWIVFFASDAKSKDRSPDVVRLLSMMGTLLAVKSILGVCFFVWVAPRIR